MTEPDLSLLPLTMDDYEAVLALWNACDGVRAGETRDEFVRILTRNPGLSSVVRHGTRIVAAVLCCHDGRRGYLYHLAVHAEFRKLGLARRLVEHSLANLRAEGINRCSIFVIAGNVAGEAFWNRIGWRERADLQVFAHDA
jgi:ribosomal protein S18 acetylase RimI-like enzyme